MSSALTLFRPSGGRVERLDPRAKVLGATLLVVALVTSHSLAVKASIVVVLALCWYLARLSTRVLLITVFSLSFFFLSTMVLRAVISPAQEGPSTQVLFFRVSHSGVLDGAQMCLQILGIVLSLSVLVRSTPPVVLAEGLEKLLAPLKRIRVPVHESVIMFSITLRFIPIMIQEFGRLQTAQFARGGGVQRGGIFVRAQGILPLLIPLFMVTLVRAKELSEAMESRGYRGDVGRSEIRTYSYTSTDVAIIALGVAAVLVAVASLL